MLTGLHTEEWDESRLGLLEAGVGSPDAAHWKHLLTMYGAGLKLAS